MRRKYFGLAIAALATLGPMQAWGGDREIAEQIIKRLKTNRDSGALKDFTLDMKVDQGVVLFRGKVSESMQKDLVLGAAAGIEGIAKVVDELRVTPAATVVKPKATIAAVATADVQPLAATTSTPVENTETNASFSLREALAAQAKSIHIPESIEVMPGVIQPAAAIEPVDDQAIVSAVVGALGRAKDAGQLKGFGVGVQSNNGILELSGRAASADQRNTILQIAENTPGVTGVREAITVSNAGSSLPRLPEPSKTVPLQPASEIDAAAPMHTTHRANVVPRNVPAMNAPYHQPHHGPHGYGQTAAIPASTGMAMGNPVVGQPVPMAPYSAVGAPRYDSPNLPNYAWPGYAAHPNYAAVTYPQQYSPSAWPYIGPFYPYPQVPLGWRKVSLEWDDGWWFLDFTDR